MATAENSSVIQFPTPTGGWSRPTNWSLYTSQSGGTELIRRPLLSSVNAPASGDDVEFAAGALDLEIPTGQWQSAGALRALTNFLTGTLYVGLRTNSAELNGNGYSRVAISQSGWNINS